MSGLNPDGRPGHDAPISAGTSKKPSSHGRLHTGQHAPDQMFQTPSRARSMPGVSGPRIGTDGRNDSFSSATRHGGILSCGNSWQKRSGGRIRGAEGSGASGNFFRSKQQESSSWPSQSGQHLSFSEPDPSIADHPGKRTSGSMKQTRIGEADAGTRRTMHSNKPKAIIRRNTALLETRLWSWCNGEFARGLPTGVGGASTGVRVLCRSSREMAKKGRFRQKTGLCPDETVLFWHIDQGWCFQFGVAGGTDTVTTRRENGSLICCYRRRTHPPHWAFRADFQPRSLPARRRVCQ